MTPLHHMYVSAGVVAPPTGPWRVSGFTLVGTAPAFSFGFITRTFFIRSDGNQLFVIRESNKRVRRYSFGTSWDVSTLSYDGSSFDGTLGSFIPESRPQNLWFNSAGTKMYAVGSTGVGPTITIYEFTLSTAWNPITRIFINSFVLSGIDTDLIVDSAGLVMKSDLSSLFIGDGNADTIHTFDFGIAGDVTTLVTANKILDRTAQASPQAGIFFKSDGTRVFGNTVREIFEYDLTIPFDLSTALFNTFSYNSFVTDGVSMDSQFWKPDGTRFFSMDDGGAINQWDA